MHRLLAVILCSCFLAAARAEPTDGERAAMDGLQKLGVHWLIGGSEGHVNSVYWGQAAGRDPLSGLDQLTKLPHLRQLNFEVSGLPDAGLETVGRLDGLLELELYECPITGEGLKHLAGLQKLRRLSLGECGLSDADLERLPLLADLEELNLSGNRLTDAAVAAIVKQPNLRSLNLSQTLSTASKMRIGDAGLAKLAAMPNLRELSLLDLDITDAGLAALAGTKLESLAFGGIDVTDDGMKHVGRVRTLKQLALQFPPITDAGIAAIRDLPDVTFLDLEARGVTDAAMVNLKGWTKLQNLSLRVDPKKFTGSGLAQLTELPNLRRLDLFPAAPSNMPVGSTMSFGDLRALPKLPHLEELWLTNVAIDEGAIDALMGMTTVETIVMGPGTTISDADFGRLWDTLRGVTIQYTRGSKQHDGNFVPLTGTVPTVHLTPEQTARREQLLADADAAVRAGLKDLAKQFPQLTKARQWPRIDHDRRKRHLAFSLAYPDRGKMGAERDLVVPEKERLSILLVVGPPEIQQLAMDPLYPHLGLEYQRHVDTGDPALTKAVDQVFTDALAPLSQWERELAARDRK